MKTFFDHVFQLVLLVNVVLSFQMNMMSLNQQAAYAQHGEQMQVFHPLFVPENPMAPSGR